MDIYFVSNEGDRKKVSADSGNNLMQVAIDAGVPGILGDCGGACACATCHCYIDQEWAEKVGEPNRIEKQMLECCVEPQDNSRLGCQVELTDEFDGLVVHLPESQF